MLESPSTGLREAKIRGAGGSPDQLPHCTLSDRAGRGASVRQPGVGSHARPACVPCEPGMHALG